MKIGIMQPYFFPYIGYYDLINRSDRWVVFDVVKYVPKSWMNRNRILSPRGGWQYITVPIVHVSGGQLIKNVRMTDPQSVRRRILGQMQHYRTKGAPFFEATLEVIERTFSGLQSDKLAELNVRSLEATCGYLGIDFHYDVLSQQPLTLPPIDHAGGWALEIATAMGATEYINPPDGRELFRAHEFAARNIELRFTGVADYRYATPGFDFLQRLSILDAIMWNAPESIKAYLDSLPIAER